MKKQSYENSREERLQFLDNLTLSPKKDSATEGIGRGYSLQESAQDINGYTETNFYKESPKTSQSMETPIELLKELNQALEEDGQEVYAEFISFLIKKVAQQEGAPAKTFNNLILKINNADLPDTNDFIKKLTKIYSRTVLIELERQGDITQAKESAYQKVLHRAEQHLESGRMLKVAEVQQNPLIVAQNIKGIIDILVSRFSTEARLRSYPNLRNKVLRLNQADIANKKSPGGAAIGTAITLIKNILNGREPAFISAVINNLGMLLS